ncbi:hypothetical protein H1S01_03475 [Heliobacterium chlorum]|uniref:Uncharacterized protein n=1 Tax=Heliobacterium chlorum TaxID=2698 RepID=A0ABR7SYF8_HELCL|nr:hypothetical protein [Heliobacterium chlorum]MBC9783573.1 hypothetical protein [Heliobacterium chlorum]
MGRVYLISWDAWRRGTWKREVRRQQCENLVCVATRIVIPGALLLLYASPAHAAVPQEQAFKEMEKALGTLFDLIWGLLRTILKPLGKTLFLWGVLKWGLGKKQQAVEKWQQAALVYFVAIFFGTIFGGLDAIDVDAGTQDPGGKP